MSANRRGEWELGTNDDGLNARWLLQASSDGSYTLENAALEGRFLGVGKKLSAQGVNWQIAGYRTALDNAANGGLRHGDTLILKGSEDGLFLDGNTPGGSVGLQTSDELPRFSGTRWRLHDNQDGSFSLENLGSIPGRRWLREADGKLSLGKTTDREEPTRWILEMKGGRLQLKNSVSKRWLAINKGKVGSEADRTLLGAFWEVSREARLDPSVSGRWSSVVPMPVSGIHTHVLPNGKILTWSRYFDSKDVDATIEGVPVGGQATYLYDPQFAEWEAVPNAPSDAFCSGHTLLPDGRLFVNGGHVTSYVGTKSTQIYDYKTNTWATSPTWDMAEGRWYPTTVAMADGDVLTISGDDTSQQDVNRIPQVWSPENNSWRNLSALASSCMNEGSGPCLPLYPWLHLLPDSRLFVSGPGQLSGFINTKGAGAWQQVGRTNRGYRGEYEATSVMYDVGKILIAGGSPVTNSAEVIDVNRGGDRVWRNVAPMRYARHKLTSTILADGSVFVSGGSSADGNDDAQSVFAGELFDPKTETWTETDHMRVPRLYHSTAVLLPDGRVMSMGGGLGAGYTTHSNLQIYSPPYLFKGDRPTIQKVAETIKHGQTLRVQSSEAADIANVNLIRLSSDTHSFNSSQHLLKASFKRKGKYVDVAIPGNPALSPSGHYILFLLNKKGVPSIGRIVRIDRTSH